MQKKRYYKIVLVVGIHFFHNIQNCTGRVQYNGLRAGVSVSQSAVFLLIKMQYKNKTARVLRFLMNVEKWVEGRQNLWRVRRFFVVLRRDISTRANLEWNKIYFHVANICDHLGVFFSLSKVCCLDIWLEGDSELKYKHLLVRDNHNVGSVRRHHYMGGGALSRPLQG